MTISSKVRIAAATAVTALLLLAGCGDPDPNLTAGPNGIVVPSGDTATAADSICGQVAKGFADAQANAPRTFAQGAEVVGNLIDIAQQGEEQLASLNPPAGVAKPFALYLVARAEVVTQLERARDAVGAEDGDAYERAREAAEDGRSRRFKLAVRAGLDGCAKAERG